MRDMKYKRRSMRNTRSVKAKLVVSVTKDKYAIDRLRQFFSEITLQSAKLVQKRKIAKGKVDGKGLAMKCHRSHQLKGTTCQEKQEIETTSLPAHLDGLEIRKQYHTITSS